MFWIFLADFVLNLLFRNVKHFLFFRLAEEPMPLEFFERVNAKVIAIREGDWRQSIHSIDEMLVHVCKISHELAVFDVPFASIIAQPVTKLRLILALGVGQFLHYWRIMFWVDDKQPIDVPVDMLEPLCIKLALVGEVILSEARINEE